jgi:hypothetical protein
VMSCTGLASQATPLGIGGWLVAQANVVLPLHLLLHFLIHSYDLVLGHMYKKRATSILDGSKTVTSECDKRSTSLGDTVTASFHTLHVR